MTSAPTHSTVASRLPHPCPSTRLPQYELLCSGQGHSRSSLKGVMSYAFHELMPCPGVQVSNF